MNKPNPLPPLELLNKKFVLDSSCPSGLRWKSKMGGKPAGCDANDTWKIFVDGDYFNSARIVYAMANKNIDLGELLIDHIDGNYSNNDPKNLRLVDHSQNMKNRKTSKRNNTGVKGVKMYLNKGDIPVYRATITATINGERKQISLGTYVTLEEARQSYEEASKKYHGEFGSYTKKEMIAEAFRNLSIESNFCPYFSFI